MTWDLPMKSEIGGELYDIATDYRDIFEIISYLQGNEDAEIRSRIALSLFYEDFDSIPPEHHQCAANYLVSFIDCFESLETESKPRLIDWEQDYNMIAAEVNRVAGREVRLLPYLHWFTFIGYFYGIGEGQLAIVCRIRKKQRDRKKLDAWEAEFYRENKSKVDFRQQPSVKIEESASSKEFWRRFNGE